MLTIRMCRVGAKKKPFFRVVVTEARTAPDGAALEVLGYYHPTAKPETLELDRPRLRHWLARGAQLSDTVRTLVARHPEPAAAAAAAAPDTAEQSDTGEQTAAAEAPSAEEQPAVAAAAPAEEPEASGGAAAEVEAS